MKVIPEENEGGMLAESATSGIDPNNQYFSQLEGAQQPKAAGDSEESKRKIQARPNNIEIFGDQDNIYRVP
jgi:hypothetical protein